MNKAVYVALAAFFITNIHADIFSSSVTYPGHPGHESVQLMQQMQGPWQDAEIKKAFIDRYNQGTFQEKIYSSTLVGVCATALAGVITLSVTSLVDWYQRFKLRKANIKRELARIKAEKEFDIEKIRARKAFCERIST